MTFVVMKQALPEVEKACKEFREKGWTLLGARVTNWMTVKFNNNPAEVNNYGIALILEGSVASYLRHKINELRNGGTVYKSIMDFIYNT